MAEHAGVMNESTNDRQAIADLMSGWIRRDLGEWNQLRDLFTPAARIEITWFRGSASDFVDASERMGSSDIRTKHLIASPVIRFSEDGRRALSETNAIIVAESASLTLGSQTHSRFVDRLEKENGQWRIADRRSIYDFASFTFPAGPVRIDAELVAAHPIEYAALAYILHHGGFPVTGTFATQGSAAEREMKVAATAWLTEEHA
ncbi:SnoaL-like protein [Subtercola boreus]|nr:SnoaL-like protein [Subtercola boreus]